MGRIQKLPGLRMGNDITVSDQLIKLALLGFINSFFMFLPQVPIKINGQNDCYKAQKKW